LLSPPPQEEADDVFPFSPVIFFFSATTFKRSGTWFSLTWVFLELVPGRPPDAPPIFLFLRVLVRKPSFLQPEAGADSSLDLSQLKWVAALGLSTFLLFYLWRSRWHRCPVLPSAQLHGWWPRVTSRNWNIGARNLLPHSNPREGGGAPDLYLRGTLLIFRFFSLCVTSRAQLRSGGRPTCLPCRGAGRSESQTLRLKIFSPWFYCRWGRRPTEKNTFRPGDGRSAKKSLLRVYFFFLLRERWN